MSCSILKQFSSRNVFGFTLQDVVREYQEKNRVYLLTLVYSVVTTVVKIYLARILVNMVDKGILCKIARDTLIRNFSNLNAFDYWQLRNRP